MACCAGKSSVAVVTPVGAVSGAAATSPSASSPSSVPKVYVIYYSMYGHVKRLIDAAVEGLSKSGVEVKVFRVPELLPEEVLEKMGAKDLPHNEGIPLVDRETFHEADGFIWGFPTRFGMMSSQFKAFLDSTGAQWTSGGLVGKPVGFLTSTGTQNGGQETTMLTAVTQAVHHGMIYVPMGYTAPGIQFDMSEPHGCSPYGPSTLAGPKGERSPLPGELAAASAYGERLGRFTAALKLGMAAIGK